MYAPKPEDTMFWHNILMGSLKRQYRKFMNRVDLCVYGTEYLEQIYQERYPHPGKSIACYTGTDMQDCSGFAKQAQAFSLVYCGNLGVGRVPVLSMVAQTLKEVEPNAKLVIYGKFANEEDRRQLCAYENVDFRGFVSYEEIPRALGEGSMVIHCENNDRLENLKTAFSTKIADSLACGKPFLVVASREYPFVQYLADNHSAHIVQDPGELSRILRLCIEDPAYRDQYIPNAKALACKNHSAMENSRKLMEILTQ